MGCGSRCVDRARARYDAAPANLLGGRALRYELRGLTAGELGESFDLDRILNHGYLPSIYESNRHSRRLEAYISDYLREEVAAEGLVRNLPAFSDFLDAAALSDTNSCQLFERCPRVWRVGTHRQIVLRHPRGHAAGSLAAPLAAAGQAPPGRRAEALFRGCGES